MSKKAKPSITTQTSSTSVDPYVTQAQQNFLGQAQSVLSPYISTPGYGVAGFSSDQEAAFQGTRDLTQQHASFTPTTAAQLDPNAYKAFLSPYTSDVVDASNTVLRRQNDETLNALRAHAAAGSAFGGSASRAALAEGVQNSRLADTIASNTATLMARGFDQATASAMANTQMAQQAGMQTATQANQFAQNDAAATNGFNVSKLQALLGIGDQQQQLEQTKLSGPLAALQTMHGLLPQQMNSTTTGTGTATAAPTTSTGQQVAGGLLSLLGLKTGSTLGADGKTVEGGGTIGGNLLSGLGSAAASFAPFLLSDEREKVDVEKVGRDPETGLDLFSYRYKGDPKTYPKVVGPMAQDVEDAAPGSTKSVGGKLVVKPGSPLHTLLGIA